MHSMVADRWRDIFPSGVDNAKLFCDAIATPTHTFVNKPNLTQWVTRCDGLNEHGSVGSCI